MATETTISTQILFVKHFILSCNMEYILPVQRLTNNPIITVIPAPQALYHRKERLYSLNTPDLRKTKLEI